MKKKKLICLICKKEIKSKDNYVHVIDYLRGEFQQEGYFHRKCYLAKLRGDDKLKEVTDRAMKMLNSLGSKMGLEEVYTIK